ncbi:hypothetical protein [uncultured Gammaproteobacteria bacterium]|jgi:hypothetical protein|nr:hypothetical protein [uncultured Gammaproteobacteria bacterium]
MASVANLGSKKSKYLIFITTVWHHLNFDKVYRMMDKINNEAIDKLNSLSYASRHLGY